MLRKTARVAAALVVTGGGLILTAPAHAAIVGCDTWTESGAAHAYCDVRSGEARLRADCKLAADHYSGWVGVGTWILNTTPCPWGIRGAIVETRD